MSERMKQIPFNRLINWIFTEYKQEGTIFGVPKSKFFVSDKEKTLAIFGKHIETPFGPAAGPHTQLAQNIVAGFLTGSRFFELKTVQTLDGPDLPVAKPCIEATDEGFNVEWSTELYVNEAFEEYVKGYFALAILTKEFGLGAKDGFAFNMSVGYDYDGITSQKINTFIEGLKNAEQTDIFKQCKNYLLENIALFENVDEAYINEISPEICKSITLSTLHGCPAGEIEKIANYLLTEKKLHTFVKMNPTILGYKTARELCDKMGYKHLVFDEHHFKNDLQFDAAISMLTRLKQTAKEQGLTFGVKLTNTFPVKIVDNRLAGEEMYMSGRGLYPLSINAALILATAFDGDLNISFSGGADAFNIDKIFEAGIFPITVATTILKPGGYLRLKQIAEKLLEKGHDVPSGINLEKLAALATEIDPNHMKQKRHVESRKINEQVPLLSCYVAPCKNGCPIHQDIPEYIKRTGNGDYLGALKVITERNAMPFTTGKICAHPCMDKCTRIDYDEPVYIRREKFVATEAAYDTLVNQVIPVKANGAKVAIIGAGPCGLSAAMFLCKSGFDVTVFEQKERLGGVVANVIPTFRIESELVAKDVELVKKHGGRFVTGFTPIFSLKTLFSGGFKYVLLAIGAGKQTLVKLADESDKTPLNVIEFLEQFRENPSVSLGKNVAIIGAGNSAMDAARAATRVNGVANVYVIYRRTMDLAPAEREEIALALIEGVKFLELTAPHSHKGGVLTCQKMKLGEKDKTGRQSPVPTDEFVTLEIDTVIGAIGERVDTTVCEKNGIEVVNGKIKANENGETSVKNVFIGGDASRGPSTIVEAMADGLAFANEVMKREKGCELPLKSFEDMAGENYDALSAKKAVLCHTLEAGSEAKRCLECNYVCNICVEVCPNRANVSVKVPQLSMSQIVHLDPLCNECGNCEGFCPYKSAPYKDKLTYFSSEDDFNESTQQGFLLIDEGKVVRVRYGESVVETSLEDDSENSHLPNPIYNVIKAFFENYSFMV